VTPSCRFDPASGSVSSTEPRHDGNERVAAALTEIKGNEKLHWRTSAVQRHGPDRAD
jgi:hypothetical protein